MTTVARRKRLPLSAGSRRNRVSPLVVASLAIYFTYGAPLAYSFAPFNAIAAHTRVKRVSRPHGLSLGTTSLRTSADNDEEGEEPPPADDDPAFLDDLKRAAASKLGVDLPSDAVAEEAAAAAESDFLSAMQDVKAEFQDAKAELGSEGAVEMFMRKINEVDKPQRGDDGREEGEETVGEWQ